MIFFTPNNTFLIVGFLLTITLYSNPAANGAFEVRIPTYDQEGRINWELQAKEVDTIDDGVYSAKKPKMFILENSKPATIATSDSGTFNIGKGSANGSDYMVVEGEGFEAIGRPWTFEENNEDARNRLAFSEHGKIGFEEEVDSGFGTGVVKNPSHSSIDTDAGTSEFSYKEPEFSKEYPTTAFGNKIFLDDLGDGKRRFILIEDVYIKMMDLDSNSSMHQFSTITCDWAEIFLGKENNSTFESFGKITQIHALGNVKLNEPLRKSSADELRWSQQSAQVDLFGNAKVFHQEWGEAKGEKIIILEEDGRAEVIGGNQGRSRVLLPPLNKN